MKSKKVAVIGSGFSGLSASTILANQGHEVHVYEKNNNIGGRARQFSADGFKFDMGPSWYWMPDVIEKFYNKFGYTSSDFYDLVKLDPGFKVIFSEDEEISIPENWEELCELFEQIEKGSSKNLEKFMKGAKYKYDIGVNHLVYQPGLSIFELFRADLFKGLFKMDVFSSFSSHVRKYFKDPRIISIMEFPVLFLGAIPKKTPALYSLMNYTGLKTGTFYPMGGFSKVPEAIHKIAESQGVHFHLNSNIENILIKNNKVSHIINNGITENIDGLIATADYHHVEQDLLPKKYRNYSESYWQKKTFAPSSLIFYLGVDKKIPKLSHHNLFFDESFDQHAKDLYTSKSWPDKPLFYTCCPSKTDPTVAPSGMENLFILIPIAAGLNDSEDIREKYFKIIIERLEKYTKTSISDHLVYKKSYCITNFKSDYNAYQGNAYGLANTLMQTANLKPKIKNKKLANLFYAGQLTVPGPGVPPAIISGEVAANLLIKSC